MENFGKFMMIMIMLIISPIINGFALVKLWSWFIIDKFNTTPLNIAEAIGLMLIISFVTQTRISSDKSDNFWSAIITSFATVITTALFAVLAGWIIKGFL